MKVCCEEMKELVKGLDGVRTNDECGDISVFLKGDTIDELGVWDAPNIIFRFCPYCGAAQSEAKDTGISFLDELKAKLFPKELEEKTSLSCRAAMLEETLDAAQQFFTNEAPKFARKIQQ